VRIYGPSGTRATPTDRNPSTVAVGNDLIAFAGNTSTGTVTYTVPAGRRATIAGHYSCVVTTAMAVGQLSSVKIFCTPNGGAANAVADSILTGAPLDTQESVEVEALQLKAGDNVTITVSIGVGAGALTGGGGFQGVEYDA